MTTIRLRANPGKFRVVGVDTFDRTDWIDGEYDTADAALARVRAKAGEMLKYHAYDDRGRHIGDAGTF